ncbi:MAG: GFA family protein [Novosphingobium sp.]|nr:MAG: GFA family protein [Novosphingobium sp.]
MSKTLTGACQCGRIRYSVDLENDEAYLCHCRMCQRATGGFAAAFTQVPLAGLTWEREPDWFQSSPIAHRPFCSACGTPLGFAFLEGDDKMDLTIGSFDDPSGFVPILHSGAESLHEAWLDIKDLPRLYSKDIESVSRRWKAAGREVPE